MWRGEPLSDFAAEQWAIADAARLTELRLAAITERAQVALALGLHREVTGDLEPLVAHDPTLESLAGLLMLALYRGGRQADALDVYTRTRDVLDEALGLEPSVSLRSLQERILRQDATLGAQQDVPTGHAAGPTTTEGTTDTVPVSLPVTMPAHRSRAEEHRTAPTNLPTVVRPLIGRDAQLDSIAELLGGVRLLSLIGPGGAGKTSLALATVVRTSADYPDGAYGVRLASVNTADQIPVAVADALGMPMDGAAATRDLRDRLIAFLARRRMLLLIDNCEHVVDAAAAPDRRHPQPLRRHHCPGHQPRSARHPRRSPSHRRPTRHSTRGHAAGRGAGLPGCTAVRRTRPRRPPWAAVRRRRPRSRSAPSPDPSTASRSRSSSPQPECRRCHRPRCPNGSPTGSPC